MQVPYVAFLTLKRDEDRRNLLTRTAEQIRKLQRADSGEHEISVCWVPRRTLVSNKILEDAGVLGDVNVLELPISFLPLEDDMFSLELDEAFNDLYLVWSTQTLMSSQSDSSTET
jgi:hypothetical protein